MVIAMKIIKILLLFIIVSLFNSPVSALTFTNFTNNGTGAINNGNGYFDDPQTAFGYTGNRNVYLAIEDAEIVLVEPISWVSGSSPTTYILINSSFGTLKDGVISNGYLYFVDGTTLKKMKTRNAQITCESNDTSAGGCIGTMASGVDGTLRTYNNVVYYTTGASLGGSGTLWHLDANDNSVNDFSFTFSPAQANPWNSFAVTTNGSAITLYANDLDGGANKYLNFCTSVSCQSFKIGTGGTTLYNSNFVTTNYVYSFSYSVSGGTHIETLRYISNLSQISSGYITTNLAQANRIYIGGQSTIGLFTYDINTYQTFNSNEVGIDSLPTVPSQLTYDTKTIESLDSQYYNKSTIYLEYNVILNSLNANNLLLDFADYRWMISMTDPNGVTTDIIQSPACTYSSVFDTTCQVTSTMGITAPPAGWLQGTWHAKLYEVNTVNPNRALITTSSAFTVLNTTIENQSVIPPPNTNLPTSGTAPQAIGLIDGFVSWLGMGVNSVSKLLFAMIFIAIAATVGLIWGNGNIAMVFAFVPYAFFTFIDYIPKWVFIIAIILIAIASKAFR